ncbi:hypothetical protein V499_01822 [Pseudogymnoascus sp. VKM F-103]|nr:hypothetical protein V499_01822 [Pseudogymnoascus sp. VKM F-103]
MDNPDLLEIAPTAIFRVSEIALALGANGFQLCHSLGAELFIVWYCLNAPTSEDDERMRELVLKLLRDVERVCSVTPPTKTSGVHQYPCMRDLGMEEEGSPLYVQAEWKIRRGLEMNTKGRDSLAETAIKHIRKFSNHYGVKRPVIADIASGPKATPDEYSTKVKMLVYATLNKHAKCLCYNNERELRGHKHIARLLLKVAQSYTSEDQAEFEILFSATPDASEPVSSWSGTRQCLWQDVQVLVPREKKVGFTDQEPHKSTCRSLERVKEGKFCDLIRLNENSRLCLTVKGGRLFKDSPQQMKQIVENEQGISLSKLLDKYRLSMEMKGALAYIVAQSVWQFYESDWMNTRWNSDTIQFIPGGTSAEGEDETQSGIFAWKPYFSVRFGEKDPDFGDCSAVGSGEIHQYPRIRALGVMLVEIGMGISLENLVQEGSETAKRNKVWVMAKKYSDSKKPWPKFPFSYYRAAVKYSLEPENFTLRPSAKVQAKATKTQNRNIEPPIKAISQVKGVLRNAEGPKGQVIGADAQADDEAETIRKRRKLLYKKVVSPLKELVQVGGWIEDLSALGPVETPRILQPAIQEHELEPAAPKKGQTTSDLKQSKIWLSDIEFLNNKIISRLGKRSEGLPARIKIAVIDTGFEETVPFFHSPLRRSRLKLWKDWVKDSPEPIDIAGHGTHIVSLIMTIAPEADIYVARVAEDRKGLEGGSGEIVAKAVEWAWTQWKVDIISMSFGYRKDNPEIKKAILGGVLSRSEKILYFAAAANFGVREPEMFPARFASVISLRGSNANGFFPDFNPPPREDEAIVYGTLGVDVPGASISRDGQQEPKSGSSIATAVGAGMAAVLLEYATWKKQEGGDSEILRKLKTQQGMLAMFRSLAVRSLHNQGHLYVSLQKLLGVTEAQRWAKFEDALAKVD